jgi:hypothetical protein
MNCFKFCVTNTHYNVKEELECQSDFSYVLEDHHTPQTPMINLSYPALWPKLCHRKVIDVLILYGPKKFRLMNYPEVESGQHFNDSHYVHKLAKNEFIHH